MRWFRPEGLEAIKEFATGLGPSKDLVLAYSDVAIDAHEHGLTVIPYTFGGRRTDEFETFKIEMHYMLYALHVDGLFTNNPDLFPRE